MATLHLVPFADLNLRAQVDADGVIHGFVDQQGRNVSLTVTSDTGQIELADGTYTAFRSDILPVSDSPPTITGDGTEDVEMTGSGDTWSGGVDRTYSYRWLLDDVAIDGATTTAYTPTHDQIDGVVTFEVTATTPAGSVPAVSAGVTVIAAV